VVIWEILVAVVMLLSGMIFLWSKNIVVSASALIFTSMTLTFVVGEVFWSTPVIFVPVATTIVALLAILVQNKVSDPIRKNFMDECQRSLFVIFLIVFSSLLGIVIIFLKENAVFFEDGKKIVGQEVVGTSIEVLNPIFVEHRMIYFAIFILIFITVFTLGLIKKQKDESV